MRREPRELSSRPATIPAPIRRVVAAFVAFLLAMAAFPLLLAPAPAQAQTVDDPPAADRSLYMDVNGISGPDEAIVFLGGTLRYKLVATNNGPAAEPAAIVQGQIVPYGAEFDRFETDTGTYVDAAGFGTWEIGALPPGESATLYVYATATVGVTRQTSQATISGNANDPNPDNDQGTAFFTVEGTAPPDADIEITKTVDNATPGEGDTIVYTVNAANLGPADATNVNVQDDFPTGITYVSDDSGGTFNPATGNWTAGDLASGATATLRITGTVDAGTTGSTIKNVASLVYLDQNDPNSGNDIGVATITVLDAGADLSVVKTVDDPVPAEGDTIVYTVQVTNGGPSDATGVEITDRLPAGLTYVSDNSGGAYDPGTGLWAIGNLDNGAIETLTVTMTVDAGTAGSTIVNDASVSDLDQDDPNPGNDTDSATLVVEGSDLALAKTVDDANPAEGDTIVYTIQVTNGGPSDATGVQVTDQLPAGVTHVSHTPGMSYDPATGVWDVGEIDTGVTRTLEITATVDAGTAGSQITNTASVTAADQIDPNPGTGTDDAVIRVQAADLSITKTVDVQFPSEGDTITFTLVVENHGPDDATGIEVTDQLPSSLTYVSDTSGGDYNPGTGIWTVGAITNGAFDSIDIVATVNSGTSSVRYTNTATITASDPADPNPDNDSDFALFRVTGADLSVTKTVDNPTPAELDTIVYTISVTNGGPDDTLAVEVTDLLPTGVTYVSDDSFFDYDENTGVWDVGILANGDTKTLNITATVDRFTVGQTITNTATVTGSAIDDPNPGNSTDSADITVAGADVGILKTVDTTRPGEGDTIIYTLIVFNAGPDDATGIEVTDQLPAGVTYVSDDSGGTYDPASGIWDIGALDNGGTTRLEITATVDAGTTGQTIYNDAEITAADQDDPNDDNRFAFAQIDVTGADLSVTKTIDDNNPIEGASIVYTVTVTNGGPDDTTGVVITDQLPPGVTYDSDDSGGTYDPTSGAWTVGDLLNGDTATLTITATVDTGTTGQTITNDAAVTASDLTDPNPGNNSNSADLTVAGTDLGIVKTVDDPTPTAGQQITYTLIVDNHGPDDATGVQVTDLLPSEVTYDSDVPSQGTYDPVTGVWDIGDLGTGQIATLDIVATVNAGVVAPFVNTATITALDQNDPNPGNDSDSAGVIITGADIGVTKTVDDNNPIEGGTITYTVTATNGGPDDATGVEILDQLPAGVTYVSDDSGGDYNSGTGIWTIGNLANGITTTLTITATVDAGTTGQTITNEARVSAVDQTDPNQDNDVDTADLRVAGTDLGIIKAVDNPRPNEGDTITYTLILGNLGPDDATGVQVTDNLPSEVTYVSDTPSDGTYDQGTGTWDVGNLANGDLATLVITATVNAGTSGSQIVNTATITALDQNDPNPDNDSDDAGNTVTGTDLSVMKTVDDHNPIEGGTIVYTVAVTNGGPDDATGVAIVDQLPGDLTYVSDDSGGGYDPITGNWTIGDLANAETATLRITATVNPGTTGFTITNTAAVSNVDQTDPNPDNDSNDAILRVAGTDLALTKTVRNVRPTEGETILYSVIITNRGPDDATSVQVTDQLPAGVTYVADDSGGDYDPATGIWDIGDLGTGQIETLRIEATVDTGTTGQTITNRATITNADQNDPNPDNDSDDASIVVAGADLSLGKSVDNPKPEVDGTVTYTVTVTNGGPDDTTGVEITDQLPTGVTYVSDDSGGTYDPTTGIWTVGGLLNGDTAALTITATVDRSAAGTTVTNTATVTATDENDPNPDNDTDTADIAVVGADVRIHKAVNDHTPDEGDTITYTVIAVNAGPDDATGVEVIDQLPAGVTYVSDDSGGSYDPATGIWTIGDLPNGGTEELRIDATVDAGTSNSVIVNEATVTAQDQADPNPDNNSDIARIIVAGADLGIVKTVDNATPGEGDTVVFQIVLTNGGPKIATRIEVTDQLPTGVTYASDDSGGAYDPATGIWTIPALRTGATTTLNITATVDAGTAGTAIVNTAAVTAVDQVDPNPDNNEDTARIDVIDAAENRPPSPVEPDGDGNLVPVDNVTDTIDVGETPKALNIVDPDGDAFTVKITGGTLPTGVTMDQDGVFHGQASQTGTFVLSMETCDDQDPAACSTFTYTLTVNATDGELPNTGLDTTQIAIAGIVALILGVLALLVTSRRREDDDEAGVA